MIQNDPPEIESIELPVRWVGQYETNSVLATEFVIQYQHGNFILTMGQFTSPFILSRDGEERKKQAREIGFIPINVVGKVVISPNRLRSLVTLLQGTLDRLADQLPPESSDEDEVEES